MITSLSSYQDYLNLYLFYYDPHFTNMEKEPNFSFNEVKILPYFTINQNGSFAEVLEERYFSNNCLSNILVLDMIQNPFVDNVVQSNLMDHHLLYLVNSSDEHNSYLKLINKLHTKFFSKYTYKSIFSCSQSPYYHAYSDQNHFENIKEQFSSNLLQYLNLFKKAFDNIVDLELLEQDFGPQLTEIFHSFSYILKSNNIATYNLATQILHGFITNRDLLNKIFNDLDVVSSPLTDKLHEGYHLVQKYIDNQLNNLTEAKKQIDIYPQDNEDFFNKLTVFLEIGASLVVQSEKIFNNKDLFSKTEKQFMANFIEESKFLIFQSDFYCLKLFIEKISPIIPDSSSLNEKKKDFVNKYSQSIKNIESLYNKYDVSLFNSDNYLDIISFKETLPQVLEEIDNILISFDSFYSFKLNDDTFLQFRDAFKNNLFISLCQNKVAPEIFKDLHLNYQSFHREIMLTKKLSENNITTKVRNKI